MEHSEVIHTMAGFPKSWNAALGLGLFVLLTIAIANAVARRVPAVGSVLSSLENI